MASNLTKLRHKAYVAQGARCFYCGLLMWESDPLSFAQAHSLTPRSAKLLKATAEHLQARGDGGKDTRQNIVAACHGCNQKRHRRKTPPSPTDYRELVQRRIAKGRWHSKSVLARCRG